MKILLVGDIFGISGRKMFDYALEDIKQRESINFIVANGENIAHGKGINEKYYRFLRERHVDVVTLGNHSFQNKNVYNFIVKQMADGFPPTVREICNNTGIKSTKAIDTEKSFIVNPPLKDYFLFRW